MKTKKQQLSDLILHIKSRKDIQVVNVSFSKLGLKPHYTYFMPINLKSANGLELTKLEPVIVKVKDTYKTAYFIEKVSKKDMKLVEGIKYKACFGSLYYAVELIKKEVSNGFKL